MIENQNAVLIGHRHQRFVERAIGPCTRGFLLRTQGERINISPGKAFQRGNQVGTDALRNEMGVHIGRRVHGPSATVGAHRNARHRLDATRYDQVFKTGAHFHRRQVDCFQA